MDREELQSLLETVLGSGNVYFQPPGNVEMVYPCIVYKRERTETDFAGNRPYHHEKKYLVTAISRDPDSDIPDKLRELPKSLHVRYFARDNLNHDVFVLAV